MEYLVGFFSSFFIIFVLFKLQTKKDIFKEPKIKKIKYSQSHIHSIVLPLLPKNVKRGSKVKSQASIHESRYSIKVILMDNNAYWIKDNVFYMADMSSDGMVDKDTTRVVDTMAMSKVQLDKMMFIIDRLREDTYDSGGSRD